MPFAAVQLPSGRWQGGFRHPVTRRKVTKTFDYSYEADAWATLAEQRAAAVTLDDDEATTVPAAPAPASFPAVTVGEYGQGYLDRRAGGLAATTTGNYATHLRGLAKVVSDKHPPMTRRDLTTLTKPDVEQWVTDSLKSGEGKSAVNARLKLLRTLCLDAVAEGVIVRNPTARIKFLTTDAEVDRTLTGPEESALLLAADDQLAAAILVSLDAGLRWQETYALTAANVVGDYLYVTQVIERPCVIRKYTKGHRIRIVPMTKRLAAALAPLVEAARDRAGADGLLFPTPGKDGRLTAENRPWDYNNHRDRAWCPTLAAVGAATETWAPTARVRKYGPDKGKPVLQRRLVPDYGWHSLRHTYGTRMAKKGAPRNEIAVLMGHADESTTKRYIHAGDDGRRLALVRAALEEFTG